RAERGTIMMMPGWGRSCAVAMMAVGMVTAAMSSALAQAPAAAKINGADTAWIIVATALVLMMTLPGLACFYAGMVRKKNMLAAFAQGLAAVFLVSLRWAIVGYSVAFSGDGPILGTLGRAFLSGIGLETTHPAAP